MIGYYHTNIDQSDQQGGGRGNIAPAALFLSSEETLTRSSKQVVNRS